MEFVTNTIGSTIFQSLTITQEERPDSFVIKMLSNNEIGGLLPITVIRKNLDVEVRYNVTSLVPLSQIMQEPLSKGKVLNILKSIVLAATQIEEYMLDVQGLVLDERRMYVNMITGETKLIYLPIENPNVVDVMGFIKRFITSLQYDQGDDFSYILKLMNALNGGKIATIAELDDFIKSFEKKEKENSSLKDNSQLKAVQSEKKTNIIRSEEQVQRTVGNGIPLDGWIKMPDQGSSGDVLAGFSAVPSVGNTEQKSGKLSLFSGKKAKEKVPEKKEEKKADKSKNKLFGTKGNADSKPSTQGKVPGFAIPGMNDVSGLPLTPQEMDNSQQSTPVQNEVEKQKSLFGGKKAVKASEANEKDLKSILEKTSDMSAVAENPMVAGVASNMDYGTTIIINQNNSPVTLMLDENSLDSDEPTRASITRIANNQRMYVDKDVFKIGKESDYVDFYIGNNPTISRTHADIVKKEDKFYIRDNSSKNHTFVNGTMIVPGELVLLNNNDKIRLSNEELVFQLY